MKKLLTLLFALIAMASTAFADPDAVPDYLCFEVTEGTTVSLKKVGKANPNIQYSFNKTTWNDFTELTVNKDCRIYFRGVNPNGFSTSRDDYSSFSISSYDGVRCSGNVMSLIDGVGETTVIPSSYCFFRLFYGCGLTTAPKLPATTLAESCYEQMFAYSSLANAPKLPATTLAEHCYEQMFYGCKRLTQAPKLPATTLSSNCYYQMFSGCESLTQAPKLPATTLAEHCYEQMFSRCRSLTQAPNLSATTLAEYCYYQMFYGCESLTQAPKLPATTLAEFCYYGMFSGCTSLTDAPELPATTLEDWCYVSMFYDCTSLTDAPKLPATTLAEICYGSMFSGCTSLTTAPELPATTLTKQCYAHMFQDCTSLITAPELPATTLAERCYWGMFLNCTNLTTAPELPAAIIWDKLYCYDRMFSGCEQLNSICVNFNKWPTRAWVTEPDGNINWVANVSETGTFVCPNNLEIKYGDCYIPKGWTVITKEPVTYTILCTDANITADKTTATIDDNVNITIKDRTSEGYKLDKVLVNTTEIAVQDFKASFDMKDYMKDVTITAQYSKIPYTITTDEYSQVANATSNMGDVINVTFKQREGYTLTSVTFNGKALPVNNYASSFTMPSANVEIKTQYSKISYTISTDDFSQVANTTANMGDVVNVTFKQREGYNLTSATFNGKALTVNNYASSFSMPAANVEIKTQYSKNSYTISTDDFSQVANITANVGDVVNVTFKQREGYNLTSATFNGKALTVNNYASSFTMPAANVEIKTVYTPNDYLKIDYLCFEVKAGTTVSLKKFGSANPNIQYSFDKKAWSDFSELTVENDCCIYFKGENPLGFSTSEYTNYSSFEVSEEFKCSGNVMSLIDGVGETTSIPHGRCFLRLFEGCPLTTAPKLPATTLSMYCYYEMFKKCTRLAVAPELPATTLAECCYFSMFHGCTSLTTTPELPATNLAVGCYSGMFHGCTSLTTTPELPATSLSSNCYGSMFSGCTSLTTAPELPATNMAESCYMDMFRNCTKLTVAPDLPATTVKENCYRRMFDGCTKLQSITIAFNTWPENGIKEWVQNVSDKGVFFCPSDLPQQFGINCIPEGWQVVSSSTTINVSSQSEYVTIDKTSAKYNEKVNFSIADRTKDGYKLDKVFVNNKEVAVSNYAGSLDMMDYLSDVTITAQYSKIHYTISTDDYSQANKVSATVDDDITITFKQRDGFDLVSATYNGNKLIVNNYKASFTMPAQDVEIKTVYNENNPKTPVSEIYSDNCAVSVFPNPAKSGEKITLKVGGKVDTNNTKIYIYNASGSLVMQIDDVKEYNQLTLKSGVYVGVLVTKGGKKTFRVAVE